jgi:hypothetical protein
MEKELTELRADNEALRTVLDQAANGQHLDDIPNHDDDSLRAIATRISDQWASRALLRHACRVEIAMKGQW